MIMTVSMPLLLAVMKLHVPINLIFCSGSTFIFLQQLELSEKMDSNFSITINTVTFVKMSFIFLGIIPFVRAIVYSQTTPSCCVMSLSQPRFSFNSVSQCPLEFDFCFQFILSKTYNSLR